MSYARYDFMIIGLSLIVVLFTLAGLLATGANVLYRSVVLQKETATRRVLGARRSHIVMMFLLESMAGVWIGILLGAAVVSIADRFFPTQFSPESVLIGAVLLLCSGAIGSWLAARHAANTPFRKSGLFGAASDKRGE